MAEFVHLHNHSHYSVMDGVSRPSEMVYRALDFDQPAIALTDHGNMFGTMDFFHEARGAGVKPIFGCEVYLAQDSRFDKIKREKNFHLVLLAKDLRGYQNLMKLTSSGYTEGFYYRPRIDKELLYEYREGLIALTACIGGEIPQRVLAEDEAGLKKSLDFYIDCFGKENLWLEIQDHRMPEEKQVGRRFLEISRQTGLGIMASNDSHYINREDAIVQEIMFATRDKVSLNNPNRFRYANDDFYLRSSEEMEQLFGEVPQALSNTLKIAEMCNVNLKKFLPTSPTQSPHLPQFLLPNGETADTLLRKKTYQGLEHRFDGKEISQKYLDRTERELDLIKKMGFSNYFLIVADFIQWAKGSGILVGPGRGSAAGALVSYALSITNIDPLRYDLLFERFLNPERITMPDIDVDFQDDRRDEVKEYIRSSYGYEQTADIITFGYLKARAALKDAGRALEVPLDTVNRITKCIDNKMANKPLSALVYGSDKVPAISELKNLSENGTDLEKQWIEYSIKIDGLIRNLGVHASGLIISNKPLSDVVPLYKERPQKPVATQYEGGFLEENGLLKMDILGLSNLTMIHDVLDRVRYNHHVEVDLDHIPLDDQEVFQLFWRGETMGVFQFESDGMTRYLTELKPTSIEDLIAMNALYRPGPMDNIPTFIARKNGKEKIDCYHIDLEPILMSTYGVIVYQEQVMLIAQTLCGFSMGRADMVRRIMAKKKPEKLAEIRPEWVNGAVEKGYPKELAENIFEILVPFSNYAFNKSHSAAYSVLAYQIAYLKTHYKLEFMAALLTLNMSKSEDVRNYCKESIDTGIQILPPDINVSRWEFRDFGNSIIFGFGSLKGMGETFADAIVRERELGGNFLSYDDFIKRMQSKEDFKKSAVDLLIRSGAFDSFMDTKNYLQEKAILLKNLEPYLSQLSRNQKAVQKGELGLFGDLQEGGHEIHINKNVPPFTLEEEFQSEMDIFGFYLSGKIFEMYQNSYGEISHYKQEFQSHINVGTGISMWGFISDVFVKKGQRGNEFALFDFENGLETYRFFLPPQQCANFKNQLQENKFIFLKFSVVESKKRGLDYEVKEIRPMTYMNKMRFSKVHIYIDGSDSQTILKSLKSFKAAIDAPEYKGICTLIFHFEQDGQQPMQVESGDRYRVKPSLALIEAIRQIHGIRGWWLY